jgi:HSP20 family protein
MSARDPKTWMWAEACELLERAERLHRQFFQFGTSSARRPTWEPPVDMIETGPELSVMVALPGVAAACLEVGIDAGCLRVAGERRLPVGSQHAIIYRLEIPYGRFERCIDLPAGRYEFVQRELVDGCLMVRLRRS